MLAREPLNDRDRRTTAELFDVRNPPEERIRVDSFDRRGVIMDRPPKRRGPGSRLAMLGSRLARPPQDHAATTPYGVEPDDGTPYEAGPVPRFPISRQGYECDVVDAHVTELEVELAELERQLGEARLQASSKHEVAREIDRIGEQTSAILVAAHDEAQQTVRLAEAHANTAISDAASYAAALTEEANRQRRAVDQQTHLLDRTRKCLMDDVRRTAEALHALADEGSQSLLDVQVDPEKK
jgi:hypothetical protein